MTLANIFGLVFHSALCFLIAGVSLLPLPHSSLSQMASGGPGAGITQLWKVFSTYGWMDGRSCVYFTIFRVLFLRLDYRQHKKARQLLARRCLLLTSITGWKTETIWQPSILIGDTTDQIISLLTASTFFPSQNTTQQNKMKYRILCVVYKAPHDFTSTYYSDSTTLSFLPAIYQQH